jgi:hypothetical protein
MRSGNSPGTLIKARNKVLNAQTKKEIKMVIEAESFLNEALYSLENNPNSDDQFRAMDIIESAHFRLLELRKELKKRIIK